jgi:hypothetical protein
MEEIERHDAVLFTSLLGKETPLDFLGAASRDRDEEVQILVCIALEALAEWANPEWLIPLLNSSDQEVRGQAGQALIPYGDRIPLEPVLRSLLTRGADYEDPRVEALGAFKEKFPRATLEQLVHSDGQNDREVAALIIGSMGEAAPIDLLATLLAMPYSEKTHVARLSALEAAQKLKAPQLALQLAELMREEPSCEGTHAPLEFWRRVLDESADMRRKYAILALGQREDAPSELLLSYFADNHLKELVFEALLTHPPANARELAEERLTELAATSGDPLAPAAQAALKNML